MRNTKSNLVSHQEEGFFKEALEEIIENPKVRYGQRGMPLESESEADEESEEEEKPTKGKQVII